LMKYWIGKKVVLARYCDLKNTPLHCCVEI
jgi:hypothetical protein